MQILSNKAFDILKWIAIIGLPACVTAATSLCAIWDWDLLVSQIIQTVGVGQVLLGTLLTVSNISYNQNKFDNCISDKLYNNPCTDEPVG